MIWFVRAFRLLAVVSLVLTAISIARDDWRLAWGDGSRAFFAFFIAGMFEQQMKYEMLKEVVRKIDTDYWLIKKQP